MTENPTMSKKMVRKIVRKTLPLPFLAIFRFWSDAAVQRQLAAAGPLSKRALRASSTLAGTRAGPSPPYLWTSLSNCELVKKYFSLGTKKMVFENVY